MNETKPFAEPQVIPKKRPYSRLAIASLFVGLGVFVFLLVWLDRYPGRFYWPGLIGIAFASIAALRLEKIHRRGGGFIAAGMILCGLAFLLHNPLVRSKALADMVKCARQLEAIGKAINAYQVDHEGMNPPDLQILVDSGMLSETDLICPFLINPKESCSYIYRGSDLSPNVPDSMILAYDRFDNHDIGSEPADNVNVLTVDGHVRYYSESSMWEIIEEDNQLRRRYGFPEKPMEITPRFDREGREIVTMP